jgi:TonB-linked SusC/RagA family outer membrane protein
MKKSLYKLLRGTKYSCLGILGQFLIVGFCLAHETDPPKAVAIYEVGMPAIGVSGTVTSSSDEQGIPGVNILVKGTGIGTVTDVEGSYSLNVPHGNDTLVFSSIGYISQEVAVNGRAVIDISMVEDLQNLDEVVVVGYGTQRRSEVTGSVGVVSGEDLKVQPSFNAMQRLRGKVPGVNIYTNSGAPTGNNRVVIRGVGTINASSDPLYVVDGVVMDNIDVMNPNDIKSIEVLKDASATAIYGARGANGVILISTERGGTVEGITVGYRFDFSVSRMRAKMDVMNAQEFMEVQRIGFENAPKFNQYAPGEEPVMDLSDSRLFDAQGNPLYDTDWQEEATRTALSQNHQLSIQSGGEKSSFGAFLNFTDRQGIVLNSWMKRANIKLVYDVKPREWLSMGTNLTVNRSWENNVVETGGGSSFGRGVVEFPPIFPVRWPDGTWTNSTQSSGLTFEGFANPVHKALEEDRLRDRNQLFGNTYVGFQITPHLEFRTQLGINNVQYEERNYLPTDMIGGFPTGFAGASNSETTYWQNENFLTYLREMGPHRINSVLGASWQQRSFRNRSMSARGFSDDFFRYNNFGTATTPSAPASTANDWTMNSYFTRLNYTYDNKYSATLTGRIDGSSRFGANSKYGVFPSAGVAWLVSNEDFMSGANFIEHLRLRASYGVTGNTEIGLFQSIATIGFGTTLIGGSRQTSSFVQRLPNPDLEWEKTHQYNIGFELNMFSGIVSLEGDYYHKLTNDLLLERPIPTTSGFGLIMDNIGSVSNRGVDFMITTRNLRTKNFLWSTTLNFNYNKNRVESLGVNDEDIFPGPFHFDGSNTILRVGEPISSFWGFERLGTWGTEEAEEAEEVGKLPGMIKRSEEKQIIGKGLPDWSGSFINRFNIGNFDITVDLQFVYGVQVEQGFLLTAEDRQALVNGLSTQLYDSWTENNQNAMVPQIRHTVLSGQDLARDSRWIADGSYLRGNLFSLGYSFGPGSLNALGLNDLRITANVENAFVLHSSEFLGYDPEGTGFIGNQFGQNTFFYQYPKPRTFTLGVNVQF